MFDPESPWDSCNRDTLDGLLRQANILVVHVWDAYAVHNLDDNCGERPWPLDQ